jgi:hypothetical protein
MNRITVTGVGLESKIKKNIQDKMDKLLKDILTQNQTANVVITIKDNS